jgi:Pyridine nucleotide-disulphide oxidoreductase, dimerisation domain
VPNVYAIGDLIGAPMEMFKARKCGVTAAKNILGEAAEFDFSEYPDFLHTTYEVTWVGLSEQEARERFTDVAIIQMPPYVEDLDSEHLPLPCAERTMLYAFAKPELSGFQKLVIGGPGAAGRGQHHLDCDLDVGPPGGVHGHRPGPARVRTQQPTTSSGPMAPRWSAGQPPWASSGRVVTPTVGSPGTARAAGPGRRGGEGRVRWR